ncbi:hypothetical protein HA466_0289120 [Hirschfeldia incana]|nr:hypothetical protein HA466_0289120 [Hirschfeldia incana]
MERTEGSNVVIRNKNLEADELDESKENLKKAEEENKSKPRFIEPDSITGIKMNLVYQNEVHDEDRLERWRSAAIGGLSEVCGWSSWFLSSKSFLGSGAAVVSDPLYVVCTLREVFGLSLSLVLAVKMWCIVWFYGALSSVSVCGLPIFISPCVSRGSSVDSYLVGDWVVKALRRGATDVTLMLLFPPRPLPMCTHPNIFFHGQNLIKLKVGCGGLGPFRHSLFRADVIFTKLRTLHLSSIDISRHYGDGIFARLLSKCPVLEELIVNGMRWHGWESGASVSSSTLKRLTIDCEHYYHESDYALRHDPNEEDSDDYNLGEPLVLPAHFGTKIPLYVSFDTPNLIYLNYADFAAFNYPLVKLDSLVEARLDVGPSHGQMRARDSDEFKAPWDATNLIMGVHNVQTLHLTSDTLEILKILNFGATCGEISLVKHFLKKMPLLKQLAIVVDFESSLEEDLHLPQVFEDLRMAPRASPNCKLEVVNY